jgi:mannose-1-phosphate guanylyltransferase
MPKPSPRPWSIVLAGGNGARLSPFTERVFGRQVPKQDCALWGTKTMLDDALDRADELSGADRVIAVVAREHAYLAERVLAKRARRPHMILQPRNRDTAAGIFLPVTYVRRAEPDAVVVILPSDHFLKPANQFLDVARSAVNAARCLEDQIVILGGAPESAEPDYGWLTRGMEIASVDGRDVWTVDRFTEKPHEALAADLMARGAPWHASIIAAGVRALWELGQAYVPEVVARFERLAAAIGRRAEYETLNLIYEDMPAVNFSSALLQNAHGRVSVMELDGVVWSDWSRADRILNTLTRPDMPAAFPIPVMADVVSTGRRAIASGRKSHRDSDIGMIPAG